MSEGKDASASVTVWMLIAAPICAALAAKGIMIETSAMAALISVAVGFWGRWRNGGIKSVAGVTIPQPDKPGGQL